LNDSFSDTRRREDGIAIFHAALAAVDPARLVREYLQFEGGPVVVGPHAFSINRSARIIVVGAGKATPAMALATEAILGDRIHAGAINTKYDHSLPLQRIRTTECAHPIPDQAGVDGVRRIRQLLSDLSAEDLVICLFSGGGSALMPAPIDGVTLYEKGLTTSALLACGATINEINTIRKHLSTMKGGGLARLAAPARVVSLMVSDVIGDPVETIASGPTAADPTTFSDCLEILQRYDIREQIPPAALSHLLAGVAGAQPETPKPDAASLFHVHNIVVGNNSLALEAAREEARNRGYKPMVLSSRIAGETRHVAGMHVAIAQEIAATHQPLAPPACLISGGETTVTLLGNGKGGRNQEFVLAGAIALDGMDGITCVSCGTDGTDGPTDAAGAIADGTTVTRAATQGLLAADHLQRNDSYSFFKALDDLVISGPTGTNVMDLRLMLVS
jgi:hydroxypyruvate reductase